MAVLGRYTNDGPCIGHGGYASVYSGKDLKNRFSPVVLKIIKLKEHEEEGPSSCTLREISVLKALRSPHIVKLLDADTSSSSKAVLVFECMESDLAAYIARRRLAPRAIRAILRQILLGVQVTHSLSYVHRDLKPGNILISYSSRGDELVVKLADFGLAYYHSEGRRNTVSVGTLYYQSPELVLGRRDYAFPVDMWAVGCVFGEMHTRRPLFVGTKWKQDDEEDIGSLGERLHTHGHWIDRFMAIFQALGTPSAIEKFPEYDPKLFPNCPPPGRNNLLGPGCEPLALDLVRRMLAINASERITVDEALRHKYFN